MGKDAGDEEENVKKYRQETVDFRILQRNGFGFPSVISLANLPQRLPSPLVALSCKRGLKYWPLTILFAHVFVPRVKGTPIDRRAARLGR